MAVRLHRCSLSPSVCGPPTASSPIRRDSLPGVSGSSIRNVPPKIVNWTGDGNVDGNLGSRKHG